MRRAFVKPGDSALAPLPDLPHSTHPNDVTSRGQRTLHARLAARQGNLTVLKSRPARLDKLPKAAAERDIRHFGARLRSAIRASPPETLTQMAFGHRVTVHDGARQTTCEITGADEADPALGRLAPQSPLAWALLGAEVGDPVTSRKPSGETALEILVIAHADPQS